MQDLDKTNERGQTYKKITKWAFAVLLFGTSMIVVLTAIFSFWPITAVWFFGWGVSYIIVSLWWKIDGFIWLLIYALVTTFLLTIIMYSWPNPLPRRIRRHFRYL